MINETLRKNINIDGDNILPIFTFKEGDNALLKLALFKNSVEFDVTGQTVKLGAKTSKGLIEQIDGFTISKNNLDIELKNSILVPGKIEIDLEIKDSNGSMTTASFFITVNRKVLNDEAVEATNEFDTFTKTVDKIESDYTGLRRIIIDENQAFSLQEQINNVNASLDTKANTSEVARLKEIANTWETFKNTGGEIGGDLIASALKSWGDTMVDGNLWIGNFSREQNGYTKLPNGLIMQWLYVGGSLSIGKGVIEGDLPIIFPNGYLSIFANVAYVDDESTYNNLFNCNAKFVNKGYFNVNIKNLESNNGSFANCYVLAIGY